LEHEWQVVAKPVGHGEVKGDNGETDSWVYTNLVTTDFRLSLPLVANCPTLFQQYIPKVLDVRVTVVGDKCISVALHSQENKESTIDCRRENMRHMRYSQIELPEPLAINLVALTRSYGLWFAAIDLALDETGEYWFLELNPAGQWAWLEQITGVPISEAIIHCLCDRL
jgi:glutathione synthase/RimK-type ligase-like ATP-grasp enzyme